MTMANAMTSNERRLVSSRDQSSLLLSLMLRGPQHLHHSICDVSSGQAEYPHGPSQIYHITLRVKLRLAILLRIMHHLSTRLLRVKATRMLEEGHPLLSYNSGDSAKSPHCPCPLRKQEQCRFPNLFSAQQGDTYCQSHHLTPFTPPECSTSSRSRKHHPTPSSKMFTEICTIWSTFSYTILGLGCGLYRMVVKLKKVLTRKCSKKRLRPLRVWSTECQMTRTAWDSSRTRKASRT